MWGSRLIILVLVLITAPRTCHTFNARKPPMWLWKVFLKCQYNWPFFICWSITVLGPNPATRPQPNWVFYVREFSRGKMSLPNILLLLTRFSRCLFYVMEISPCLIYLKIIIIHWYIYAIFNCKIYIIVFRINRATSTWRFFSTYAASP